MSKGLGSKLLRSLRYIFYCTTLNDLQEDIEYKRINFNKFLVSIPSGTSLYRLVREDDDPITPTGIGDGYPENRNGHRWVSTPHGFSPDIYRKMYYENEPQVIACGTGAVCMSLKSVTSFREVSNAKNMDLYKLILKKDIRVVDLELICKALRIRMPLSKEHHPVYHKFYGMHIRGIKFKTFKFDYSAPYSIKEENIIIYSDWFKEFKDIVSVEKVKKEEFPPPFL